MEQFQITKTLMFTDIEGSSRLWETEGSKMPQAIARHDELLSSIVREAGGHVFKNTGDGICAAFNDANGAIGAAVAIQERFSEPTQFPLLRIRVAIHSGVVYERMGDYFGEPLSRISRMLGLIRGGQVILSESSVQLASKSMESWKVLDQGVHLLRGLQIPERLYLLAGPGLDAATRPAGRAIFPTNLRPSLSSFVGRTSEIRHLQSVGSKVRLLTLVGPGGIGKTRLANELGHKVIAGFSDGVWFVPLESINDQSVVIDCVADHLQIRSDPAKNSLEELAEALSTKSLLLILDNCEHLLDAVSELVKHILERCPTVQIVTTSRERLGLEGEYVYEIPPLRTPGVGPRGLQNPDAPIQTGTYEGVRLFIERALFSSPGFRIGDHNVDTLYRICDKLAGIPLAIELAAARTNTLSLDDIDRELDSAIGVLASKGRQLVDRHRTLSSTMEWSLSLLTNEEQLVFEDLSVFSGWWTLSQAEEITEAKGPARSILSTIISTLVDKSLIVADRSQSTVFFHYLEPVKQFAREKLLRSGRHDDLFKRHFYYFLGRVSLASEGLRGHEQIRWRREFDRMADDMRSSIEWAIEQPKLVADAAALACDAVNFWMMNNWFVQATTYLNKVRSKLPRSITPVDIRLDTMVDVMEIFSGNSGALLHLRQTYGLAKTSCPQAFRFVIHWYGAMAYMSGEADEALPVLEEALRHAQENGESEGYIRLCLGALAIERGDFKEAELQLHYLLRAKEVEGDTRGMGLAHCYLGHLGLEKNGANDRNYVSGIRLLSEAEDYYELGNNLVCASDALLKAGRSKLAARAQGYASWLAQSVGCRPDRLVLELGEQVVKRTVSELGEREYAKEFKKGRSSRLQEIAALFAGIPVRTC